MTALIRTLVPLLWGYVITWLAGLGVPAEVLDELQGWSAPLTGAVLLVATAAAYQAAQWLIRQDWVPDWLARIFAGSIKQPVYPSPPTRAFGITEDGPPIHRYP